MQTSADAYRQKKLENRVCGGAPYRGYSSFFSYVVGFGCAPAPPPRSAALHNSRSGQSPLSTRHSRAAQGWFIILSHRTPQVARPFRRIRPADCHAHPPQHELPDHVRQQEPAPG